MAARTLLCDAISSHKNPSHPSHPVEKIKKMDGMGSTFSAPLMSNLAVSRRYRRRGLAEDLVRAADEVARKEWGYDECYLYVEGRNAQRRYCA
ncbi:hypothetical protein ACHAWF_004917 [Thalassiosira exigua]